MRSHKADYHFDLGNAFRQVGSFDEALQEYRQTLAIKPRHPQAQNNIGIIFWNLKAYERAEIAFKKALDIQQDLPDIHQNLATLHLKNNRYADAIPYLEQVLKLQPGNATARKLLDHAQMQKGPS